MKKGKLPPTITVELLRHMSENGRFEQTLTDFPDLDVYEIRETFAWLAKQVDSDLQHEDEGDQRIVNQFINRRGVSKKTKKVLNELSPEEGATLLRSFGALE